MPSEKEVPSERSSSRGRRNDAATVSGDYSVLSEGVARVALAVPQKTSTKDITPPTGSRSESRPSCKAQSNPVPPDASARGGTSWLFPGDSRSQSQSRKDSSAHITVASSGEDLLIEAFNTYGILAGAPTAAKTMASKVAVEGAKYPSINMIIAIDPPQPDLAAAIVFASAIIAENCRDLQRAAGGHAAASTYLRIWDPISADAEAIKQAPASMLRYLLFLCLMAVEDVHYWANIGAGGPPGLPVPRELDQAMEFDYRKEHGLPSATDDGA